VGTRVSWKLSYAATVAAIVFMTLLFRTVAIVNATTVGFAYLIAILLVAASWGIRESVVASIVATVCLNYFYLPPVGTWAISDPENWVALASFLISSLIASELSNRARRRTAEANTRKIEMERLYALSRAILTMEGNEPVGDQIVRELRRVGEIPEVAIYDRLSNVVYRGSERELPGVDGRLREIAQSGITSKDTESGTIFAALSLGGTSTGSIALRGADLSETALHALLNLIAITLDHARSREIVMRAQAARQSEEFKSTLLDGLAHEFKTPLTSIKAAATALLASSVPDAAQQHELLTIVDQEAGRLTRLVTEATRVARIEAGNIDMNREWHSAEALINGTLAQMESQRDGRRLDVVIARDLPAVYVDGELIQLALRQLLDNALKYSPQKSAIRISSRLAGNKLAISVRNEGEPLSDSERARIFDKFYRGHNVKNKVAGTGMGLPVARDILLVHGGDVQLTSTNERGTEFVVTIPLENGYFPK
jgi:two-component system sensor histidine kinase KdpD